MRKCETEALMGRITAQNLYFKTGYISQPSSEKRQREIKKICVVCERKPQRRIIEVSI